MPKVTIVVPLSRDWRVQTMHDQLYDLIRPDLNGETKYDFRSGQPIETEILLIIDNPYIRIDWPELNTRTLYMDQNQPGESNAYARRQRIADILNLARTNIDSDYTFIIEDDTDIPPQRRMWQIRDKIALAQNPKTGIISGIQAGRWAASMIGIWKTDNIDNPTTWETLPFPDPTKTPDEADATGLYYAFMRTELFKNTPLRCTYQGPDVNFGLDLRRKGYYHLVAWNETCGHTTHQKTIYPTPETGTVKFIKDDLSPGGWKQTDTINL